MRGEYELTGDLPDVDKGSPPHARGIPAFCFDEACSEGITPACAGNTSMWTSLMVSGRDHPRMRGEYILLCTIHIKSLGSPPHARGIHNPRGRANADTGITPACAGNTLLDLVRRKLEGDHPRMRGEYASLFLLLLPVLGSPPHARGIQTIMFAPGSLLGITPACAGNTGFSRSAACSRRDHPRMRGEYQTISHKSHLLLGSPPHARGIPDTILIFCRSSGITPACAGNTRQFRRPLRTLRDHPRMRGEYSKNSL